MRRQLLMLGSIAVIAIAIGGFALWYLVLRDTAPAAVSLEAAAATAVARSPAGAGSSDVTGTWSIPAGSGSFAGYRVNENLAAGVGSHTAVGRSEGVSGFLLYDGKSITSVQLSVDMTALKSEQSIRDDTLKMQAIQTCQYPSATFTLTTPIAIDSTSGSVAKTVQGNLTLHGVTKPVSIDVKGQMVNGQVVIVGSTTIKFSDYNIQQPQSFYVVSLDDHGIMEFQLTFARTSAAVSAPAVTPSPVATPSGCSFPGGPGGPGGPGPGGIPRTPPAGGFPGGGPGGGVPALPTFGPTPPPVVP